MASRSPTKNRKLSSQHLNTSVGISTCDLQDLISENTFSRANTFFEKIDSTLEITTSEWASPWVRRSWSWSPRRWSWRGREASSSSRGACSDRGALRRIPRNMPVWIRDRFFFKHAFFTLLPSFVTTCTNITQPPTVPNCSSNEIQNWKATYIVLHSTTFKT